MKFQKRNSGIWDFVDTILPSFERIQILDEVERVIKDTKEVVLPGLDINDETIRSSATHNMVFNALNRSGGKLFKGNVVNYIKKVTELTIDGKDDLIKLVEKTFNRKISKEGLDYKRGHLLHLVSLLEFYNRYAIQFLLVTTKEVLDDKYYPVDKVESMFVKDSDNINKFVAVCHALEHEFKNYTKLMVKVDGITMDEDTREVTETTLGEDADPLSVGFYTVDFNPFYLIGKVANQIYVFFFDIKREQARKLALHVTKLKQQREGASEEEIAAIDKAIGYHSDRLNKMNGEIEEVLADARDI